MRTVLGDEYKGGDVSDLKSPISLVGMGPG